MQVNLSQSTWPFCLSSVRGCFELSGLMFVTVGCCKATHTTNRTGVSGCVSPTGWAYGVESHESSHDGCI